MHRSDKHVESTSGDKSSQSNQWEIKPKDVKLPPQTKVMDFIRKQSCGIILQRDHRPDRAKKVREDFINYKKDIQEKLNSIQENLKETFEVKVKSIITGFRDSYKR
jgi:hypothetical protein